MLLKFLLLVGLQALCLADMTELQPYAITALNLFKETDYDQGGELTEDETIKSFKRYDANGDAKVSHHEFAVYLEDRNTTMPQDAMHAIFRIMDADDDDSLTTPDFKAFFLTLDRDGNGAVSQSEFINYWVKTFEALEQLEQLG